MSEINYSIQLKEMPIIPLRGMWIYPNNISHFDIGRDNSLNALNAAMLRGSELFAVTQKDSFIENPMRDDFYHIGTVVSVRQTFKLPNGTTRVLVEGVSRGTIEQFIDNDSFFEGKIEVYEYTENDYEITKEIEAATRLVLSDVNDYIAVNKKMNTEILLNIIDEENPDELSDLLAGFLTLKSDDHYELIKTFGIYDRLILLHKILRREIEFTKLEDSINQKVNEEINDNQKEYYLREQMNIIQKELGTIDNPTDDYVAKIKKLKLKKSSEEHVMKEARRLDTMNPSSPETNIIRSYLDHIIDIPWNKKTKGTIDLEKSKHVLEDGHYGLKDVKERILEYLAVKKMTGDLKGPILCLVGPPGVGKTSIAKSIAESTNRKFVSMRLGGVRDEAEIRGHRKTYIGAMPGRIITLLERAASKNPVFLLDEIDKLASDFRGDPASALLEVLDPQQNNEFIDNFIEIPVDLSDVLFVTTANSIDYIPDALLDRMEIIRVSSYTAEEKFMIATKYLIPRQIKENGLEENQIRFTRDAINILINNYTRESGVRNLERVIGEVMRKAVIKILTQHVKMVNITKSNLEAMLGPKKITDDELLKVDTVGVVNGLAWTQVGGVILSIECNTMNGTGKLQLTGKLGDVMKESALAAITYIRSNQEKFGIDENFYKEKDIHIHVPEGAVSKDGPSAGVTMATAVMSRLTGREVRHDVAMTGEITLTGRVLPIGGVKEKVLAAHRHHIQHIILPASNEKDIEEISLKIRKKLKFYFVKSIDEVFDIAIRS